MKLPHLILRTVIALTIGLAPILCCCATETDAASMPATSKAGDAHACCGDETSESVPVTPDSGEPHECGCDNDPLLMAGVTDDVALQAAAGVPSLDLIPLPRALQTAELPSFEGMRLPSIPDVGRVPAAPTLRTLSVLLLT